MAAPQARREKHTSNSTNGSFIGVYALYQGIEIAGSIDKERVTDAMKELTIETARGRLHLREIDNQSSASADLGRVADDPRYDFPIYADCVELKGPDIWRPEAEILFAAAIAVPFGVSIGLLLPTMDIANAQSGGQPQTMPQGQMPMMGRQGHWDRWNPNWMQRAMRGPGQMGAGMQERMARHWTFSVRASRPRTAAHKIPFRPMPKRLAKAGRSIRTIAHPVMVRGAWMMAKQQTHSNRNTPGKSGCSGSVAVPPMLVVWRWGTVSEKHLSIDPCMARPHVHRAKGTLR